MEHVEIHTPTIDAPKDAGWTEDYLANCCHLLEPITGSYNAAMPPPQRAKCGRYPSHPAHDAADPQAFTCPTCKRPRCPECVRRLR